MKGMAALLMALCVGPSALAAEIEPFVTWVHGSDITRGPPFNDDVEPQYDFVGMGVTVRWRKVEFEVAHGWQAYDCNYRKTSVTAHGCRFESGTIGALRIYPWRKR